MTRFVSRGHAVESLAHAHGKALREMAWHGASSDGLRSYLADQIDLAWFPPGVADRLESSDRAWKQLLNDIIKQSL